MNMEIFKMLYFEGLEIHILKTHGLRTKENKSNVFSILCKGLCIIAYSRFEFQVGNLATNQKLK